MVKLLNMVKAAKFLGRRKFYKLLKEAFNTIRFTVIAFTVMVSIALITHQHIWVKFKEFVVFLS